MDKTVRVGRSPLSLHVINKRLVGAVVLPSGDVQTFLLKPSALESALKQLKKPRSPRCQRPKKSQAQE